MDTEAPSGGYGNFMNTHGSIDCFVNQQKSILKMRWLDALILRHP